MSLSLINEVFNTIPYYVQKNKRLIRLLVGAGITFGVTACVGVTSFYLGQITSHERSECPLAIDIERFTASEKLSVPELGESLKNIKPQKTQVSSENREGGVVVSRNGTKYHFPWCAGAGQIKEENKVWYTSEKDAQSAGYTKAGNCQ